MTYKDLNQITSNVGVEALMTGRKYNSEDDRPLGKASTPSSNRDEDRDKRRTHDHRQERLSEFEQGYLNGPAEDENRCRSCGATISKGRNKCPFCRPSSSDSFPSHSTDDSPDRRIIGVIHMLVESASLYGAVAKGGAAAKLLCKNDSFPAVHVCRLIYDLDKEPASQLTEQWPILPEAASLSTDKGQELLAAIRDQLEEDESESRWVADHELPTCLYDESGDGIRNQSRLEALIKHSKDEVWIVPAIAIKKTKKAPMQRNQDESGPATEQLECIHCENTTEHEFQTHESIPVEDFSGQAIWECQECGGCHYAPDPE